MVAGSHSLPIMGKRLIAAAKALFKILGERIDIQIFNRNRERSITVLTASALSLADPQPIGGLIARPYKTRSVNKGLYQTQIMPIALVPVTAQSSDTG